MESLSSGEQSPCGPWFWLRVPWPDYSLAQGMYLGTFEEVTPKRGLSQAWGLKRGSLLAQDSARHCPPQWAGPGSDALEVRDLVPGFALLTSNFVTMNKLLKVTAGPTSWVCDQCGGTEPSDQKGGLCLEFNALRLLS